MKKCTKCGKTQEITEFYRIKKNEDKRVSRCRTCENAYKLAWEKANRNIVNKNRRGYESLRKKEDPAFLIARRLRSRLSMAVKNIHKRKKDSTVKDLGCTIGELIVHLESQFEDGMSWNNYGEWEIDHIVSFSKFDLTDREQLLEAFNYKNIRPFWPKANKKRNKVIYD